MRDANAKRFVDLLSEVIDLSPDVRLGQLLAHLGFLADARAGRSLWDVEDAELLELLEEHRTELARRTATSNATASDSPGTA